MPNTQNKVNIDAGNFSGGKNEFPGLTRVNQFTDSDNMEFFNGELRTRKGNKFTGRVDGTVGSANGVGLEQRFSLGAGAAAASVNIGGLTVGA